MIEINKATNRYIAAEKVSSPEVEFTKFIKPNITKIVAIVIKI